MKYTCYGKGGDILREGNNKRKMISFCSSQNGASTIVDETSGGIIYENKAQRDINNGKNPGKTHYYNLGFSNRATGEEKFVTVAIEADEESAFRFATNRGLEILREMRKPGKASAKWFLRTVINTDYWN